MAPHDAELAIETWRSRERFDATVTADSIDHDLVRLVTPASESDGEQKEFSESTEQFDLDEALDRL